MEIEISTGICSNCKGLESCNKCCILHSGKALVDFITRVDMIDTRIGEYESREKGGVQDLVVSGHKIWDLGTPSFILTSIANTTLDASPKFKNIYNKSVAQLAMAYCNSVGMSKDEINEITTKIQKLNKNKLLVLPFKPKTPCNVDVEIGGTKDKKKEGQITNIRWDTDPETFKLNCTVSFKTTSVTGEYIQKYSITQYIDKFRLSSMEMHAKGEKHDKNLIKITNYGIFKPIVVKDGNKSIAIDGTYLYSSSNSDNRIIGYWDGDKLVVSKDVKSPALKKIMDNMTYIRNHKKYMAPYMLYEPNVVEV
jgi:hypothetical protein